MAHFLYQQLHLRVMFVFQSTEKPTSVAVDIATHTIQAQNSDLVFIVEIYHSLSKYRNRVIAIPVKSVHAHVLGVWGDRTMSHRGVPLESVRPTFMFFDISVLGSRLSSEAADFGTFTRAANISSYISDLHPTNGPV